MSRITLVSAGAGSGKTYDITSRIVDMLTGHTGRPAVRPEQIIATTFTHRAADELGERIRARLQQTGRPELSDHVAAMYVGTVHGVAGRLLRDYTYELGLSPELEVMPEEDLQQHIDESLSLVLTPPEAEEIDRLARQFGLVKRRTRETTWSEWIKQIAAAARTNAIDPSSLEDHAAHAWDALSEYLPEAQPNDDLVETVREELHRLLARDLTRIDTTKLTAATVKKLTAIAGRMSSGAGIGWGDWETMRSAGKSVGKAAREYVEPLAAWAEGYAALPSFQSGLRRLIELVYDLAHRLIDVYQEYKRERGLMDFVDQEAMLLSALQQPDIAASVGARFRVLVVDEFQDTSPMQLAIFMRLTELVEQVVWVGDPKQSIYGFRDADPELMRAATTHVGAVDAVLDRSYRSRPDLVHFANALFIQAFAKTPVEKVRLTPNREEDPDLPRALRLFPITPAHSSGKVTKGHLIEGLVRVVRRSLDFRHDVVDKDSGRRRRLNPGDIAILTRKNATVREIAAQLEAAGIPVAAERDGLTDTLEYHLITAALRYVMVPHDTLAEAELRLLLSDHPDPEALLQERLAAITANGDTGWLSRPTELDTLDRLRLRAAGMALYRLTDEIITAINVHRVVLRFGHEASRRANIDLVRSRIASYDQWCARFGRVPQVAGFLQWMEERERRGERDQQAAARGEGAVNVLTYHRAKGLEWPLVIPWDLDQTPRVSPFGLTVDQTTSFDTTAPLAGRMLRWWPPTNAKIIDERVADGRQWRDAERRAHEESHRLLYVGLTRARDYLFVPLGPGTKKDPSSRSAWLNDALGDAFPLPETTGNTTITVGNETVRIEIQPVPLAEDDPFIVPEPGPPRWYDPAPGPTDAPPLVINPSLTPAVTGAAKGGGVYPESNTDRGDQTDQGDQTSREYQTDPEVPVDRDPLSYRIVRRVVVGDPLERAAGVDLRSLGEAYHHLAAILVRRGSLEREVMDRVLSAHGIAGDTAQTLVTTRLPQTLDLVRQTWGGGAMLAEVPIHVPWGDQYITGTIDLLMERHDESVVLVDHKVHAAEAAAEAADLDELVGRYVSQLWWYQRALAVASLESSPVMCLAFPVQGVICEVEIGESSDVSRRRAIDMTRY